MNTSSLRRTRIIALVLFALVGLAFWYFIIGPRFTEPEITQQQVTSTLDQKSIIDQQILALQRRQEYLPAAEEEALALNTRFPPPALANAAGLGLEIAIAAQKAGIPEANLAIEIGDPVPVEEEKKDEPKPRPSASASASPGASASPSSPANPVTVPEINVAEFTITVTCQPEQLNLFVSNLYRLNQSLALDSILVSRDTPSRVTDVTVADLGYVAAIEGRAFYLPQIPPVPDNLRLAPSPSPSAPNAGRKHQVAN